MPLCLRSLWSPDYKGISVVALPDFAGAQPFTVYFNADENLIQGEGDLPEQLPSRIVALALFLRSIGAWVTDHSPEGDWHTNDPCRRGPVGSAV